MEPPSIDEPLSCLLAFVQPVTPDIIVAAVIMLLLLVCSALISGSEVAYFSLSPSDINDLNNDKSESSQRILNLLNQPQHLLATILISNNFVNIGVVIISTYLVANLFDFSTTAAWVAIVFQVGVVTFLLLLLGEVVPKVYATVKGLLLCKMMNLPLTFLNKLFYPLSSILISSTNVINRRIKKRGNEFSSAELEQAIELTKDKETTEDEEKILKGIARFGGTDVKQIMTPRTEIQSFDQDTPYAELLEDIVKQGYSRIPIYKDSLDKVIGVLYLKDLLPYSDKTDVDWLSLLRPPFFVPENKKLDDLLAEFKLKKIHLAVVVDEYGGTSGIVTLEDIIEEIVGDITDEFDDEHLFYSKLDDRNYVFEGKTPLVDLYKILDINGDNFEEAKGESDTLAGFILELTGKIPMKNERVRFENYDMTIEAADKRRIKRVKITIREEERNEQDH